MSMVLFGVKRALCRASALTVLDFPACLQQLRMICLSLHRRRSRCQGSGSRPWARRITLGSSAAAMRDDWCFDILLLEQVFGLFGILVEFISTTCAQAGENVFLSSIRPFS